MSRPGSSYIQEGSNPRNTMKRSHTYTKNETPYISKWRPLTIQCMVHPTNYCMQIDMLLRKISRKSRSNRLDVGLTFVICYSNTILLTIGYVWNKILVVGINLHLQQKQILGFSSSYCVSTHNKLFDIC